MKRFVVAPMIALLTVAGSATAQYSKPPVVEITPYAGYMVFGNLYDGPFGTSLSNKNSPLYGAQLGLKMSPNISLVGNVGYASSSLKVGVPFFNGFSFGTTNVLLYDGGLELGVPLATPILHPFVTGGVGAIRYSVEDGLVKTTATNLAYNAGGGFDLQFTPNFGLRLLAKDYIGKFDFKDAANLDVKANVSHNWGLTAGVKIGF
jgi:hypothetical protein